MMQGGGQGVRTAAPVVQGGSVEVDVGPNDSTVEISVAGADHTSSVKVEPNKRASIPVPPVPGGTLLFISVGKGARAQVIVVEVIAPPP